MSCVRWLGRWRDAGAVLHGPDLHQPEARQEIDPVGMVRHGLRAFERLEGLRPLRHGRIEASQEVLAVLLEGRAVLRRRARQSLEDVRGDDRRHPRVERVVRIAERMHVAHGAVDARRGHLEHRDATRRIDPARGAGDHAGIVRALDDEIDPVVEVEAVDHEDVGPPHLHHEARAHLEVVGVLGAAGEGVDLDEVAAHHLRERLEIGRGRDDADLVGGVCASGHQAEGGDARQ